MEINVLIDGAFRGDVTESYLELVAGKALFLERISAQTEMGVVITGQDEIHKLNRDYYSEDRPTDVLSFAMRAGEPLVNSKGIDTFSFVLPPDGITHLGEVIISYPQAEIQAKEHNHSIKKEITVLLIHGILHLLGYDHDEPERQQRMRGREETILSKIAGGEDEGNRYQRQPKETQQH